VIWPDFSVIPSPQHPFLCFEPLQVGAVHEVCGHRVQALPAQHNVPAVGYAVATPSGHWVFTGDTCSNPAFWRCVNELPMAMLVIECAFSEREYWLALRSQHLSPSLLAIELDQLDLSRHPGLRIGLTHAKPSERLQIEADITALGLAQRYPLIWLESGQRFDF